MFTKKDRSKGAIEDLRHIALFAACSDEELRRLDHLAVEVTIPAGKPVVREGRPGQEFFVITSGLADVEVGGQRIATLGPGEFFGEMALLLLEPRTATVTARTDLTVLAFNPREFDTLIKDGPTVAHRMLREVASRLRSAMPAPR